MTGESLVAPDIADEIVVQVTLKKDYVAEDYGTDDTLTFGEWKQAIVAVLARYGAALTDEHEAARFDDDGGVA
jgi:hypothetical protein